MPLHTQVVRDGEPLQLQWGIFHVTAMVVAVAMDSGEGPFESNSPDGIVTGGAYQPGQGISIRPADSTGLTMQMYAALATTPLGRAPYTLRAGYRFRDSTDGEVFELRAGDQLIAYRD